MRSQLLVISMGLVLGASQANASTVNQWSKGPGPGWATAVAADAASNIGVAAVAAGPIDFGQGPVRTRVGVIAHLAPDGHAQWTRAIDAEPLAVGFDASGNMIIMGSVNSPTRIDFGGRPLPAIGGHDAFLLKVDGNGNHVWSRRVGDSGWDLYTYNIAVDARGNTVWSGVCGPATDFGAGPVGGGANMHFFIVKYTADGTLAWQKAFGESQSHIQVATNAAGDIVASIELFGTVRLDGKTLTSRGINDIVIAWFSADGVLKRTRQFGSAGIDSPLAVAVDDDRRVAFIGKTRTGVNFGGGPVSPGFVTVLDTDGSYLWGRGYNADPDAVAIDPSGHVVITGHCGEPVDFGGGVLAAPAPFADADVFAARFDVQGNHLWSDRFRSKNFERGRAVASDAAGNFVLAGSYGTRALDFGSGPIESDGADFNIFVAKFGEEAPLSPPSSVRIDRFDAIVDANAVALTWEVSGTGNFTLLRRQDASAQFATLASGASTEKGYQDASVEPGSSYDYQLVLQGTDGLRHESSIASVSMPAQKTTPALQTSLGPNAPNPFNPSTSIQYTVGEPMSVAIDIFDVSGRMVARLQEGMREPGTYRVEWNGRNSGGRPVASGIYLYRFAGVEDAGTRKMILLK